MRRFLCFAAALCLVLLLLPPLPARADAVTDTIGIYVGYFGWAESEYREKVTYHWTELDDWIGGALDTRETIYSYYSGSRTYLVAARGFTIRDLLYYAGVDFGSIASIDFFTQDHANGAYRSFSKYSLLDMPRYYFPNLAADEETGEVYAWDGDDIWNSATTVEAMLALEDYTEWDTVGSEFEQRYDPALLSPNCRFHLFFGQAEPTEASTSSAAKYCYKLLITFAGTPVLSAKESDMSLKLGSGRKLEIDVDAEDGLLNDYVREHLVWVSSDESVVTVAEDGTVTVVGAGSAVVTASFGNSAVSVNVTVEEDAEETDTGAAAEPSPAAGTENAGTGGAGASGGEQAALSTAADAPTEADPEEAAALPPAEEAPPEEPEEEPPPEEAAPPEETVPEEPPEPEEKAEEEPETGVELTLPPPETPEAPPVTLRQVYAIRPELLAGTPQSSPQAAAESGAVMDEDSVQLVLTPPERSERTLLVLGAGTGAFVLGFVYELLRYRRLRKRG